MALDTDGVLRSKIIETEQGEVEMTGFRKVYKELILGICMKF